MPRNRKYFPHGQVLFISTRTECGLPFVPNDYINFCIWGFLARAQSLAPVSICHFLFMGNHFHLMLVIEDPQAVPAFMCSIKTELAHMVNKLLGRKQRTIWQNGYDSPIVLDANSVIEKIKYIYNNPTAAKLVHTIKEYPGVSSWDMFTTSQLTRDCPRVARNQIAKLSLPALSINEAKRMVKSLQKERLTSHRFKLEPDAWRDALNVGNDFPSNEEIISEIKTNQEECKSSRIKNKESVIGATRLRRASILKEHEPDKFSPKMICLSSDKSLRRRFIAHFKALSAHAREIYQGWLQGMYHLKIPPGLFCPRLPEHASALLL